MAGETERLSESLSKASLSPVIESLAVRAELGAAQQRAFREWAESIVERLSNPASAGLSGLREGLESLRQEFRAVHAGVAAGWLARGSIDEELVCRRSFLGHVIDVVGPQVGQAPSTQRYVKAAA